MRAASVEKPGSIRLQDAQEPRAVRSDDVVVKVMASGICGTDVHIFRGEYLGGYPIVPGHEFSGVVSAVGQGVKGYKPGDRVAVEPNISCDSCPTCLSNRQNFCENWQAVGVTRPGGMAQYVLCPEKVVFDAGSIPFERAAFMEPLSCVIHGIENVGIRLGDTVAVIGMGPIGMLLLRTARAGGAARFTAVELSEERLSAARRDGITETTTDVRSLPSDRFDVVVDATGAPAILPGSHSAGQARWAAAVVRRIAAGEDGDDRTFPGVSQGAVDPRLLYLTEEQLTGTEAHCLGPCPGG